MAATLNGVTVNPATQTIAPPTSSGGSPTQTGSSPNESFKPNGAMSVMGGRMGFSFFGRGGNEASVAMMLCVFASFGMSLVWVV